MIKKLSALLLASAFVAAPASAQVFSETFTTPGTLVPPNWVQNVNGQIVTGPDGNNALNFAATRSGSDLVSRAFTLAAGDYRVSVDYGCTNTTACGGYLGLIGAFGTTDGWFATDDGSGYPVPYSLTSGSTTALTTNTFRFTLGGGNYQFKLEDFNGAAGNVPGDAFFRNLSISAVPEPATWALMIMGFGAVGGAMRRRTAVRTSVRYA